MNAGRILDCPPRPVNSLRIVDLVSGGAFRLTQFRLTKFFSFCREAKVSEFRLTARAQVVTRP